LWGRILRVRKFLLPLIEAANVEGFFFAELSDGQSGPLQPSNPCFGSA
jgi:hypothetical protein